jgi:hypothetical protein
VRRVLAAYCAALGLLGAGATWAESAARESVVLLLPPQETPTALRLRAEIEKLDVRVQVAELDESVSPDETRMAELASFYGAEALVLLSQNGRAATIWFGSAEPGERLKRVVEAESGSPDVRSDSVVIGTMELLRVRLLTRRARKPEPPPPAPPPSPPPPAPPPPPAAVPFRPLVLGALVALDKPGPDFGFGSSYQLNIDWALSAPLSLRAVARLPAASSHVKLFPASAEVRAFTAAGALVLGGNPIDELRLDAFVGPAAARVSADGLSEQPAYVYSRAEWVPAAVGGVRGSYQLTPALGATVQFSGIFAARPVEIWLLEQLAGTWGRPALSLGMGLELRPNLR